MEVQALRNGVVHCVEVRAGLALLAVLCVGVHVVESWSLQVLFAYLLRAVAQLVVAVFESVENALGPTVQGGDIFLVV